MKILFLILLLMNCSQILANDDSRLAIHLLDYLANDYVGAVADGKVKSASEYDEQLEFSSKIVTIISDYHRTDLLAKGQQLKSLIENKKDASDVALLSRSLQRELISYSKIKFSPEVWPSIKRGAELYKTNCLNCHGSKGFGDGIDGKNMLPLPANFHKLERMNKISAFHCYNTIRLGVPGTGMVAFDKLDDKQIWDLAFYVMSIPYSAVKISSSFTEENLSLSEISLLSNEEITSKFPNEYEKLIVGIRTNNHQISFEDYINTAQETLDEAFQFYLHGENNNAKKYAIQAYLQGIEPIEPAIKANRPELIVSVETSMSAIRKLMSLDHREKDLKIEITKAQGLFLEIKQMLVTSKLSFKVAMMGTFVIVLREGLEAVLLLVTLLSVVGAMKNRKAIRYIHYGWSSAVAIGFLMWFLSGELINVSGVGREMMEAFTALLAVVVLLYFGFWLHQKSEVKRWKTFIDQKINNAVLGKNLFTLFSISFMAVFREAFETVLFIRSLWFQTSDGDKNAIPFGLLLSLLIIALLSYLMLRYSKKLPIRKLFQISSMLMTLLAIVLTGKAIHSFQEIGFLPIHSLSQNFYVIRIEILGVFPNWEGILGQGILAIIIVFFLSGKNLKKT
jgi:high-affinity iron transporter